MYKKPTQPPTPSVSGIKKTSKYGEKQLVTQPDKKN